ncbi:MAG: hypothetical protein MK554_12025, partial [Planctomycetes bacterium]|nr:hypothetical protein [Planctomycetota bacterium]
TRIGTVAATVTRIGTVAATVTRIGTVAATVTRIGTGAATVTRIGALALFVLIVMVSPITAITGIRTISATVSRIGTIAATVSRIGTIISTPTSIAASHVATPTVITAAAVGDPGDSAQRVQGGRESDIAFAIDDTEVRTRKRIYIDIIFTGRAQLQGAASGGTGGDTSDRGAIFSSYNLVNGFRLESIDGNHRLLRNITNSSQNDQSTGTIGTATALRTLSTLTVTSATPVAFIGIVIFVAFVAFVGFVIFVAFIGIVGTRGVSITLASIGIGDFFSRSFLFSRFGRRQSCKTDSERWSLIVFGVFSLGLFLRVECTGRNCPNKQRQRHQQHEAFQF